MDPETGSGFLTQRCRAQAKYLALAERCLPWLSGAAGVGDSRQSLGLRYRWWGRRRFVVSASAPRLRLSAGMVANNTPPGQSVWGKEEAVEAVA